METASTATEEIHKGNKKDMHIFPTVRLIITLPTVMYLPQLSHGHTLTTVTFITTFPQPHLPHNPHHSTPVT
jgi:hypothetical protein